MPHSALHIRLDQLDFLGKDDFYALSTLMEHKERFDEGEFIVVEDQEMNRTWVVLDGWAYRYKSFEDGRRQILSFVLPGDIIGFYSIMLNRSDYGVEALTGVESAVFPSTDLIETLSHAPKLALGLSWIAGQSERLLDEQITRIGRRSAAERMAHLCLELYKRMIRCGADDMVARTLPLTQSVLADALGMSHVHANRSFRTLTKEGCVKLQAGNIFLVDIDRLAQRARFDAHYLEQPSIPRNTRRVIRKKIDSE